MTDTDLTDINGVGPSRAESLEAAGFESAEDVAEADTDTLEEALGPSADPEDIRNAADEAAADTEEDGDTSATIDSPRGGVRELEVDDRDTALYLIKGLIDEDLRLKKRNEYDKADDVMDLIVRMLRGVEADGGTFEVDRDDLDVLYSSVRNIEQEFQGTRGITDQVGRMRNIRLDIQSLRSELRPA